MSYVLTKNETVAATAVGLLLQQFKGKPRMEGLLSAFVGPFQELENVFWDILTKVNIDTGESHQLDLIGSWLGVKRYGLSDATYRVRLRVEILIAASNGTINDLMRIMVAALALQTGVTSVLTEPSPATALVRILGTIPAGMPQEILWFLNRARPLGVKLYLQWEYDNAFTFASGSTPELDTDHGWGSATNPAIGGLFSGVA